MDDVQIDGYAGNTERGPVARVDTVDLIGIVNSGLKTRRDAPPCWYGGAEAALLNISSRVPATGLKNSRHTQTAVPQTDIGPIIVSFDKCVGRAVVARAKNSCSQRDGEECC